MCSKDLKASNYLMSIDICLLHLRQYVQKEVAKFRRESSFLPDTLVIVISATKT